MVDCFVSCAFFLGFCCCCCVIQKTGFRGWRLWLLKLSSFGTFFPSSFNAVQGHTHNNIGVVVRVVCSILDTFLPFLLPFASP